MQEKIIDFEDAIDRVQDDKELLFELFDIFEDDFKVRNKDLKKYVAEGNIEMVRNITHSLKGAAGNISAKRIQALCLFIEQQTTENTLEGVEEVLGELDEQFQLYLEEAKKVREENA